MSKGLEALKEHIINLKSLGFTRCEEWLDLIVIEKELKEYEEMKRIKGTTTLDNALEETLIKACTNVAKKLNALEIIKDNIAYTMALCDKTKNHDNDLIKFEIKGFVDKETWQKIYEAIGTPRII